MSFTWGDEVSADEMDTLSPQVAELLKAKYIKSEKINRVCRPT